MKVILLLALFLTISCDNASTIWNFLRKYFTRAGTAGLMGNLEAESGLESAIYEWAYHNKIGLSNEQYCAKTNSGEYTNFVHDSAGFGLAQWTYYSRKQALYNKCKGKICDMNCQLQYLVQELKSDFSKLYSCLTSSNDLSTCSKRVLMEFERPANAEAQIDSRYQKSKKYYDRFS